MIGERVGAVVEKEEEWNEQEVRENFHFYSTRLWGLLRIVYVMWMNEGL